MRITRIGGPTALIEWEGWRILTDPTFDPPGRSYAFAPGASSRKTTGPAIELDDIGPHRRGAAEPPRSRRQPGRRRPRRSGARRRRRDDGRRRQGDRAPGRAWAEGRRDDRARRAGTADRHDRRHGRPARRARHPAARRAGDRIRPDSRRAHRAPACGSPATPSSTAACAARSPGSSPMSRSSTSAR